MKIYGPYLRPDGRKHIVIIHADKTRQTKSYPRYLLEQHIGRELTDDETCDHKDDDFTNDDIDNLQILSRADNINKAKQSRAFFEFNCPMCGNLAFKPLNQVKHNHQLGKRGPYCSRSCAGKAGSK